MEKRLLKWLFYSVLCSGLLLIFLFSYNINTLITKPMLTGNSQPVLLHIKPNSTAISFVNKLLELKLIHSRRLFLSLIRVQGFTNRLKAGIYEIEPGESAQHLLCKVVRGDVLVKTFRIIEGTSLQQISENLQNAQFLTYDKAYLKQISGQHPSAEGLLLADTYYYDAGDDAKSLLNIAHKKLIDYLNSAWETRTEGLPYKTPYEMLIAASILEKETALANERKIIAGVIANRLNKNMPLQMDPTVIYALGKNYQGKLVHDDLSVVSAYNTYKNRGLPPTPIAMVGKESIDAAAHPQASKYLYFVAKGDGGHEFSETYPQQKKAVLRYKYKLKES